MIIERREGGRLVWVGRVIDFESEVDVVVQRDYDLCVRVCGSKKGDRNNCVMKWSI